MIAALYYKSSGINVTKIINRATVIPVALLTGRSAVDPSLDSGSDVCYSGLIGEVMRVARRKPQGHYCKICGERKSNESFSGMDELLFSLSEFFE